MNKFVFGVLAIALGVVSAVSDDEITALKTALKPVLEKCGADYGLTFDAIIEAAKAKTTDSFDPCFHSCFFKAVGVMNEEGLFTPDAALEQKRKLIKPSEKTPEFEAEFKKCTSVNDQEVSDGAKGCERAKLIHACIKDKLPGLPL